MLPAAPYEINIRHSDGTLIQAETIATEILMAWRGDEGGLYLGCDGTEKN